MFETINMIWRGIKQRYASTNKKGVLSWILDQAASLISIAFGTTGAVKMATDSPQLTAALTSVVALNSLVVDTKASLAHWGKLTTGARIGAVGLEIMSLTSTLIAVGLYCKTTIDTSSPNKHSGSVSDVQDNAARLNMDINIISAVLAYTVSPLIRKLIGSCASSLRAVNAVKNAPPDETLPAALREHELSVHAEIQTERGQMAESIGVSTPGSSDQKQEKIVFLEEELKKEKSLLDQAQQKIDIIEGQLGEERERNTSLEKELKKVKIAQEQTEKELGTTKEELEKTQAMLKQTQRQIVASLPSNGGSTSSTIHTGSHPTTGTRTRSSSAPLRFFSGQSATGAPLPTSPGVTDSAAKAI